jgi:uncharacterized protein YkwD
MAGVTLLARPAPAAAGRIAGTGSDAGRTIRSSVGTRNLIVLGTSERRMLDLIQRARERRGRAAVRLRGRLLVAGLAHSRDMLRRDYFSHYSYSGESYDSRLRRFGYRSGGYAVWRTGEVIGWGRGTLGSPRAVFRRWMRSSGHRAVIVKALWRDVGVGCVRGTYCGMSGVRMYTVDFGRRQR